MGIDENEKPVTSNCKTGTLLFVADFVTGGRDVLDFACELAERQNADLQLLHVIDPEHTYSSPDAQMGAHFSLEMLAQRARALKRSAVSLLSFGSPERVIPRRAAEVNASMVVLPLNGSAADRLQKRLASRLRGKCNCPVLAVPREVLLDTGANSFSIHGLLSQVRQACEGDRQWMRKPAQATNGMGPRAPLMITPRPASFVGR